MRFETNFSHNYVEKHYHSIFTTILFLLAVTSALLGKSGNRLPARFVHRLLLWSVSTTKYCSYYPNKSDITLTITKLLSRMPILFDRVILTPSSETRAKLTQKLDMLNLIFCDYTAIYIHVCKLVISAT